MRYVAAYLLLVLGGKTSPTVADIEKLLASVGVNVDQSKANYVVNQLKGKRIEAVMAAGALKLGAIPAGRAMPAAGGDSGTAQVAASEEKSGDKEEEKPESDDSDDDMGFGLFGNDDD